MMHDFTFFDTCTICIGAVPKFFCSVNGPESIPNCYSEGISCMLRIMTYFPNFVSLL